MKKHNLPTFLVLLALGTIVVSLDTRKTLAIPQDSVQQSMGLAAILFELGRDYDCVFTIEEGWMESEPGNRLEVELTQRTLEMRGLTQELEALRHSVPNFSYEINPVNPRVVHVIDARLKWQKGYALEATIASLDFTGKVNELPDEIGRQGIPIALPTWRSLHEQRDGATTVRVEGQGLTVRYALSNFVKLDGRDRILWIARTRLDPGAVSYVFYPWPGRPAK